MIYRIQDAEAGNIIEDNLTLAAVKKKIAEYKKDDGDEWDADFYEIVAYYANGDTVGRWNGDFDYIDGEGIDEKKCHILFNIEKMSSAALRQAAKDYFAANDDTCPDIDAELNRRNRAAIFKAACVCLRNCGRNQFEAAATFADAVIDDDPSYYPEVEHYEIGGYYTKTHNPVVVYF